MPLDMTFTDDLKLMENVIRILTTFKPITLTFLKITNKFVAIKTMRFYYGDNPLQTIGTD